MTTRIFTPPAPQAEPGKELRTAFPYTIERDEDGDLNLCVEGKIVAILGFLGFGDDHEGASLGVNLGPDRAVVLAAVEAALESVTGTKVVDSPDAEPLAPAHPLWPDLSDAVAWTQHVRGRNAGYIVLDDLYADVTSDPESLLEQRQRVLDTYKFFAKEEALTFGVHRLPRGEKSSDSHRLTNARIMGFDFASPDSGDESRAVVCSRGARGEFTIEQSFRVPHIDELEEPLGRPSGSYEARQAADTVFAPYGFSTQPEERSERVRREWRAKYMKELQEFGARHDDDLDV
jgi:hypothetical protein